MKHIIVAIAMAFSTAAFAGPAESVQQTVSKLMAALRVTNEQQKIKDLCSLVKSDLDNGTIATVLLGTYQSLATDTAGVAAFRGMVPSVIMDQFYGLLNGRGDSEFTIGGTVPKGSGKVGVKVVIGTANFIVTVLRANNKVVDVEWNNLSIVSMKRDEFQRDLQGFHTDKPVTALVERLNANGVNRCR